MKLHLLIAGVGLVATQVWAGSVSNVSGTLDTTLVDPAPAAYPHFICASGCNVGSNTGTVSQAGVWSVGVSNFPAVQTITGTVSIPGMATSANQPALNGDGGGLSHITNLPAVQSVSGIVSVGNFPTSQTVNGSITVPGVASAANQPGLNLDGGGLAHITNWPSQQLINGSVIVSNLPGVQPVSGTISVGNFPSTQPISGTVNIGSSVGFGGVGAPSSYVQSVQGVSGGAAVGVTESDGANTTLGSKADSASANGSVSVVALLKQLHLDELGALAAGSAHIGSVGIDPAGNIVQQQGFAPFVALSLTSNCYAYTSPATLYFVGGYAPQANLWVLIYNANSTPADGSQTPATWFGPFPNSGDWNAVLPAPLALTTGMTLCYSTTGPGTKTSTSGIAAGGAFKGEHN